MANKLPISDQRMLALLEWVLQAGEVAKSEKEYFEKIGFARTNISNVRRGHQSFARDHIINACKITGANANWIFGFESNMMRSPDKDPIARLKEAVVAVEQAYGVSNTTKSSKQKNK